MDEEETTDQHSLLQLLLKKNIYLYFNESLVKTRTFKAYTTIQSAAPLHLHNPQTTLSGK